MTPTDGTTPRPLIEQCRKQDGHNEAHEYLPVDRVWGTIAFGAARCLAARNRPRNIEQAEADLRECKEEVARLERQLQACHR